MLELFNTVLSLKPVKLLRNDSNVIELLNNFKIIVYGDFKTCSNVIIVNHGAGYGVEAPYIISFLNRFKNKTDTAIIIYDCPGYGINDKTKHFFGPHENSQNLFIDDIIDFILNNNKLCNIYNVAFSFGAGAILAYLSDTQNLIKNRNKNKIKQSFLISPIILDYEEQIEQISKNFLSKFISIMHSKKSLKFWFKKLNIKKCFLILKNITNIDSIVKINGTGNFYKHSNNKKNQKLKTTIFISKKDPVTPWEDSFKNIINFNNHEQIYFLPGCGHIGFFTLSGNKIYEDLIYSLI